MPELPEIETIVRQLRPALRGRRIVSVHLLRPDILRATPRPLDDALRGRVIRSIERRAKRIQVDLGDRLMVFHLGMSGRLTLDRADVPVEPHTHLRLKLDRARTELRFRDPRRFGGVWLFDGVNVPEAPRLGPVGPEPLTLKASAFEAILRGRRGGIKPLLMDQRVIAGLGNIYVDESLFHARIHPLARAGDISPPAARRLHGAIQHVLRCAIRSKGSTLMDYRTAEGVKGEFQRLLKVFRRTGLPCPRCRTPIERLIVAGRSTHVCPQCQSLGAPDSAAARVGRARDSRRGSLDGQPPGQRAGRHS